jgi:hypothetical protein
MEEPGHEERTIRAQERIITAQARSAHAPFFSFSQSASAAAGDNSRAIICSSSNRSSTGRALYTHEQKPSSASAI